MDAAGGQLTFDADQHAYWWTAPGQPPALLLSVTQALSDLGFTPHVRWVPQAALVRGTAIHATSQLLDTAPGPEPDADDPDPYQRAYERFATQHRPAWVAREVPLADPVRRFAGTPDAIGTLTAYTGLGVLDIKSGVAQPWHDLQVAGYAHLARVNGHAVAWGAILYVRPSGRFLLHETSLQLIPSFLEVVNVAHLKRALAARRLPLWPTSPARS